jgi:hypothetical protein
MAKKKKINYTPYIVGAGALGILAYAFKDDIKNLFKKESLPEEQPETPNVMIENVVTPSGITPIVAQITPGFNKIGTPKDQLNFDQYYNFGDKGQEVAKMQQILNRIAEITKKPKIKEDGIYGQGTQARLSQMFKDTSKINLYKMYAALFAIYIKNAANKNIENWFNYYDLLISSPQSYAENKNLYFKYNKPI